MTSLRHQGWWERWPWRLVQTNLREVDMADIDAERYVASLKELHATVAMINTSGIIASYPTALPFHVQSSFLDGDGLVTVIDACHAAGIKVIARTDFSKVRRELYDRHPEWASVRADGRVIEDAGDVHVCPAGPYQQEYAPRIVAETITVLDVDGMYFNMAGFQSRDYRGHDHGICHCAACVAGFRSMFDLALPTSSDVDDPVFRRYLVFQDRTTSASKRRLDETIRRLRPDMAIDRPSDNGGGFVRQESSTALDRTPPEWPYSASANTKWVVSSLPRTVSSNSSVDFVDYPVRHVAVSPDRQRLRLAQALANGGGLDHYVIGRLEDRADRSGLAPVREIFGFHAAHEEDYMNLRSCAPIALATSRWSPEEFRGWFRVLVEHHFLFDTLTIEKAGRSLLSRYAALILADHQPISDDVAASIDRFVEEGGTLVATGRTGWRDGELEPRMAPALRCLGIERVRELRAEMRGAYFEVEGEGEFPRLAHSGLVFLDGAYVDAEYRSGSRGLLRLIPPGPFGPPERCVLPAATGEPGLVTRRFGRGRVLYVPWSCGALFDRHGQSNTSSFAADVLERHAGMTPVGGNLSAMVEVTLSERSSPRLDGGMHILHLVNGSGAWAGLGPVSMRDLEIEIPLTGEPVSVMSLVTRAPLRWHAAATRLRIEVPALDLFEAILIEGCGATDLSLKTPSRHDNVPTLRDRGVEGER